MLAAVKNSTVTNLQKQVVAIKSMELNYWMSTFRMLTTESALLTGFAFGSLSAAAGTPNPVLNLIFLAITASSMGFGTLCISTASFSLIFGQERALMGDGDANDSMDRAIEMLKNKSYQCFYLFTTQLVCFHLSSFMLMWILYPPLVALFINAILAYFLYLFITNGLDVFRQLFVDEKEATSNDLDSKPRPGSSASDNSQLTVNA